MMMAASAEDNKGFNFGNMKYDDHDNFGHDHDFSSDIDNSGVNSGFYDDDIGVIGNFEVDDDIAIDFDSFFTILNEPELPINPFYSSMDNTQEDVSAAHVVNNDDFQFQQGYGAASENSAETVEALEQDPLALPQYELLTQASGASFGKSDIESGLHQSPNSIETDSSPSTQDWLSVYNISAGCPIPSRNPIDVNNGMMLTNEAAKNVIKRDLDDSQSPHSWTDNKPTIGVQVGAVNVTASEVPVYNFLDGQSPDPTPHDNYTADQVDTVSTFDSSSTTTDEASAEPFGWSLMDQSCFKQAVEVKDKKNNGLALLNSSEDTSCRISEEAGLEGRFYGAGVKKFIGTHKSGGLASRSIEYHHSFGTDRKHTNVPSLKGPVSSAKFGASSFKKVEVVPLAAKMELNPVGGSHEPHGASLSDNRNSEADDDDDDVCIIEDFRVPVGLRHSSVHGKSVTQHLSSFSPVCSPLATSFQQVGVSGTRAKATGERLIFQAVVQDLSQPKSEASPPDGVLAVPLLRHQRIALSWMVQKETTSLQCSGGILADDQGLGKTVSTIALILTERAPSARTTKKAEQGELEMLDLDEEDNKQVSSGASSKGALSSSSVRGRPSGGTLVVCPTSVLRQWNDELRNKVTDKAKLSVCIYHGSSRTKDPYELANYDIVLTTYSIVSMEVPKPVSVKDGNDQGKLQSDVAAPSKKRKHSSTSDKRCSKRGVDNGLLESAARPLARVGWFRVVLDEAQSIKNYRTQVAQACWGLRAKRRWCLSGTPIQNAVDDLYSYFRFLRYEPYSVYKSFCYNVKLPITRDPTNGYIKLQAVLKTIMLRRTKGTLLDGEPIINLPPKSVKLKKVEFSEKERAFYTRLEADSRAQFQAYAALGTVKQNYVNILLMLLRLRQACDHPFLVKGHDSSSVFKSSIHAAKKLPREQQLGLLNCLEASLAICGICNDPPEDAVVSVCGHVFCSQCISERLTGDENHCPVTECKTQLNVSSVFSKGTLKSCLSVESCQEGYQMWHSYGFSDQGESAGSPPASFNSSKIRAALEVLQSLPKLHRTLPDNVEVESSVTDDGCFDKSSSSFSSRSDSSVAGNGPASASSGATEKAIVFSQWTSMLDLLEACLKESTIQYRRLDGTMSVIARDKAVKDFNTIPEVSVMIMSLKAASLGLNMVAACHVILLDLWWNPTTEDQAIDRAHRIGQTRPVTVVRLTVKDTVEDRILALQQKKRELVASCFGEDETGSRQSRLTVEDLQYLFMA